MHTITEEALGINGFGRIGKLTVWHHIARKYFKKLVVNIGRNVGSSLEDIAHYLERDSTYGSLSGYLHGFQAPNDIIKIDTSENCLLVNNVEIHFLQSDRNPVDIEWLDYDIQIVVDTTGQFLDPTVDADISGGAIRGHLEAGASKVIISAPFKIKDKSKPMPEDCVTTVMGINDSDYDPRQHSIISNASCTTTCLAHMVKPLIDYFGSKKILTASMATIHAATGSQQVLDRLPKKGATDLRKNRSIFNNIILTSTGAAQTLKLVIPEMKSIGFIAESVRIPSVTGSLVILLVNLQEEISGDGIRRELINQVYQLAAKNDPKGYLQYSDKQNVSMDIVGLPRAASVIEGHETHTRTAEVSIDLNQVIGIGKNILDQIEQKMIRIPITQTIVYGWYDNELASYVNMLGDRTITIAETL
ncbi:Glyceraldehyde-3-phosphate dehydrogenase [Candidatus Magnetomorum sp. HK-1]|nr:Glyceraldehyde-3-phosphate dehydrogenase [Candidatus Magnetomorum sp. HK-1]